MDRRHSYTVSYTLHVMKYLEEHGWLGYFEQTVKECARNAENTEKK